MPLMKKPAAASAMLLFLANALGGVILCAACAGGAFANKTEASAGKSAAPYFTGDGGKGRSIAILAPQANGLTENQNYLPVLVQGEMVNNFSTYSAISVLDRVNLDEQYAELLSGYYAEDAQETWDLGHLPPTTYLMGGNITRTAAGYALQMRITRNADKMTVASYSGTCSFEELDNLTGIRQASLDLLQKMGIETTGRARTELTRAAASNHVNAQTTLAQGITAQRQGTEVAALSYFFQAAAFDPSLAEASNRSSVLAANISSGNLGADVRNEIQWRRDWIARLAETEEYFNAFFDNFFKTTSLPYTLYYSTGIIRGEINFQNETTTLSIQTYLRPSGEWFRSIDPAFRAVQATIKAVNDGLDATKRKAAWGLDKWPQQGGFNLRPFGRYSRNYTITAELVNDRNQVIGRQTFETGGTYDIPAPLPGRNINFAVSEGDEKTVSFANVRANDITDSLTIRIASVNGQNAEAAARGGVLQIRAISSGEFNQSANVTVTGGVVTGALVRLNSPTEAALFIPASAWDEPVNAIGNRAFIGRFTGETYSNRQISVIISDGVTRIGDEAFAFNRHRLTRITIGANVSIEYGAFREEYQVARPFSTLYDISSEDRFKEFYDKNGRKAGTYTYDTNRERWSYSAR